MGHGLQHPLHHDPSLRPIFIIRGHAVHDPDPRAFIVWFWTNGGPGV